MEGFLQGYRILDLTDEKGHLCGRLLGDMGADVIKIEPPEGDASRHTGPFYHDEADPEKNLNWFYSNANKRGISLNLKTADGCGIFRDLARSADIVLESYRPGYIARLGLDYGSLVKINPDIILTSITPFGQNGPYAHYKVTDIVAVSMAGMAYVHGDEDRPPVRIGAPQAYYMGSQHAAIGALSALYHRELTGGGDWIDASIHEAIVFHVTFRIPRWGHHNDVSKRSSASTASVYPCRDGEVALTMGSLEAAQGRAMYKSFLSLLAWANEDGYASRFADTVTALREGRNAEPPGEEAMKALTDEISAFLLTKTKAELLEEGVRRRILLAPVSNAADVLQNPQLVSRDFWSKVYHPQLDDTLTYPGASVRVEQCPQSIRLRAPALGEHNREIYGDELGLLAHELNRLQDREVI